MALQYEEIQTALQNNDQALAAEKAQEYLDELKNLNLNIAITGESGSGKSTLVNALRGIRNDAEGAAPTGVTETTMKPTEYLHPENDKIRIWDLPGIGTIKFTADKYLEYVEFKKFDFFIIVSSERFRENDAKLAKEIQKMKKKFYFVRSKIDHSIQDEKKSKSDFNEEKLLNQIRDDCIKNLLKEGIESPKVFLVASHDLRQYEFDALWKTLEKELPKLKRDVLLLALPNISAYIIEQKKKALERKIVWYTVASAAGAAVLVPGYSELFDLNILVAFAEHCEHSLGLNLRSLKKLSDVSGVSLEDLKAEFKSPFTAVQITTALVLQVLKTSTAYITLTAAEEGARFVPVIGIPVAMALSSVTTYKALEYILNTLAEDAQRVFIKALNVLE